MNKQTDNKLARILLLAAAVLTLLGIFFYSEMAENRKTNPPDVISLEEPEGTNTVPKTGGGAEGKGGQQERGASAAEPLNAYAKELLQLSFSPENAANIRVFLWQNAEGTCYLFLPGFARNQRLILNTASSFSVMIGNALVEEGDMLQSIVENKAYEIALQSGDGEILITAPCFFCIPHIFRFSL